MLLLKRRKTFLSLNKFHFKERFFTGSMVMETAEVENALFISVAKDFSDTPGPRYSEQGEFSGEDFFGQLLLPKFQEAIKRSTTLVVDLDGTEGYASSFLEEAFGGLSRYFNDAAYVRQHLDIISTEEPHWKEKILNKYIPNGIHA
jgi:hypothetical protein